MGGARIRTCLLRQAQDKHRPLGSITGMIVALKLSAMRHQDCQGIQTARPPLARKRCRNCWSVKASRLLRLIAIMFLGVLFSRAATAQTTNNPDAAELLSKENSVDTARPSAAWRPATVGQKLIWHERLRTGEDSRAAVRMSDSSILRVDELTETEILPPEDSERQTDGGSEARHRLFF